MNISKVWVREGDWAGTSNLDGERVEAISPTLEPAAGLLATAQQLRANRAMAFKGMETGGDGYLIDPDTARRLIAEDPRVRSVVKPYVNAASLGGGQPLTTGRWVIDFGLMSESDASGFPGPFALLHGQVYEELRRKAAERPKTHSKRLETWWRLRRPGPDLRAALGDFDRCIVLGELSKHFSPVLLPTNLFLSKTLIVIATDSPAVLGAVASSVHYWWAVSPPGTGGSSMKSDPRYTAGGSFETFPLPPDTADVRDAAETYLTTRERAMQDLGLGLTAVLNRMHDPSARSESLRLLRLAQAHLDMAVLGAYGVGQGSSGCQVPAPHDFFDCGHLGVRFTLEPTVRAASRAWLLEENIRRFGDENGLSFDQALARAQNV